MHYITTQINALRKQILYSSYVGVEIRTVVDGIEVVLLATNPFGLNSINQFLNPTHIKQKQF